MAGSLNLEEKAEKAFSSNALSRSVLTLIALITLSVFSFLLWILYVKEPLVEFEDRFLFLPALNALLNAFSATCVILGVRAIRRHRPRIHMRFVLSGCFFTVVFLISYIFHHVLHGNTPFLGTWWLKAFYFGMLGTHILVAAVTLPLILTTLYLAFTGQFSVHRRLARYTFPAWLYMSVTGVLIFLLLKLSGSA